MVKATFIRQPDFSGLLRDNPFHLFYNNSIFNDDLVGAGLSDYFPQFGTQASRIVISDTYFEEIFGVPEDHYLDVDVTFFGSFERQGGEWSGTVDRILFAADGDVRGGISGFNGQLDLSDFFTASPSEAWDIFAVDGFRGSLSNNSDYAGLSHGDDNVNGRGGDDTIFSGLGDDVVRGGLGNDSITLSNIDGVNFVDGGAGNDFISGGFNTSNVLTPDTLKGGTGADYFEFGNAATVTGGRGPDTFDVTNTNFYEDWGISGGVHYTNVGSIITDFRRGEGDRLKVDDFIVFDLPEFARYRRDQAFTGEGYFEVRMENGVVEIDAEGDGEFNSRVYLEGLDTLNNLESWFILPTGVELL